VTSGLDPFATAGLRAAIAESWRLSQTRLLEDCAAESDLVSVGYRDRLFTELAANGADAAAAAGVPGTVAVWVTGRELHVANTGAPLSAAGVRSLTALRVSAKAGHRPGARDIGARDIGARDIGAAATDAADIGPVEAGVGGDDETPPAVGRFGVGFTATATIADTVEIRSRSGSVLFDRARTWAEIETIGVAGALTARQVPLLRLVWESSRGPADGFDTEIVLTVRAGIDLDGLLVGMIAEAPDLLLELTALSEIDIAGTRFVIHRRPHPEVPDVGTAIVRGGGAGERAWLVAHGRSASWLVETDATGAPVVAGSDVLRAPTPTDIELSLPARCITTLALTPDRRRVHPDADLSGVADGYLSLMLALAPASRPALIPRIGLARNDIDAAITAAVLAEVTDGRWLPTVADGDVVPGRAVLFADLTAPLADALGDLVGGLVCVEVSSPTWLPVLRAVGVDEIGLAGIADRLAGADRPPRWWWKLYDALSPLVFGPIEVEALGALPVPRTDGRLNFGARGLLIPRIPGTRACWITGPDPEVVHPLLERLGAQVISTEEVIALPELRAAVVARADDPYAGDPHEGDPYEGDAVGADTATLVQDVLSLLAADPDMAVPEWLSVLPLPDEDGEWVCADELLLPGSPLAQVLDDQSPFGTVDPAFVAEHGVATLRRLGAGWGFLTVVDDMPVAADHDLPDEELWWDTRPEPPRTLRAVRDLDLVDPDRWPAALSLLATDERTAPLIADRDGYTAWWLRRHARIGGRRLGDYRAPDDPRLAGVLDPLEHPHADLLAPALGGIVESVRDAQLVLDRLADPDRVISPGAAVRAHGALVAACVAGTVTVDDLAVPEAVRRMDGSAGRRAVVLDRPWLVGVIAPSEAVIAGLPVDPGAAALLADILDVGLASEQVRMEVVDEGTAATWDDAVAVAFAADGGHEPGHGEVRVHDRLRVRGTGEVREVRWWVDDRGITHLNADRTAR